MVLNKQLKVVIAGTDTGVGKTWITTLLTSGLRSLGRRVWVHKPVACGDWADNQAEDGRSLTPLADPDQPPETVCPVQFREACSPHLAAKAEGASLSAEEIINNLPTPPMEADLVVEGVGGLLVPLGTDDSTLVDLAHSQKLPLVIVTRPHLGTLNHTCLTVKAGQAAGLTILGFVINHHERVEPSLATRTAGAELERLTDLPVLAEVPYKAADERHAEPLAKRVLEALG